MGMNRSANPFLVDIYGTVCQATDSASRIYMAKQFTAPQCRAALKVRGLQKTVKLALERRLRQLDKADGGVRDGTDRTTSGRIGQP